MIREDIIDKIFKLHNDGDRHSNYQNFPEFLTNKLGIKADIDENWRGDKARYKFINENIEILGNCNILDIGANTGKFCLELAYNYPNSSFYAYEKNSNYIELINLIKNEFNINNIFADTKNVDLDEIKSIDKFDIIFHLNVLHHAGFDYDIKYFEESNNYANYFIKYLKELSYKCNKLVFQMGYNLGGNKNNSILSSIDVKKMIEFELNIFKESGLLVDKMGIYNIDLKNYEIVDYLDYTNCLLVNNLNNSSSSEFYKRPLFILNCR